MQFARLNDIDVSGKTVLIREDLNVPLKDGKIANDARLKASLPTIQLALDKGAAVIVCSHLGRPDPSNPEAKYSLQPVADYLGDALGKPVKLVTDYAQNNVTVAPGEVVLLENVRFNAGEKKNDAALSERYAALCDVFVMDAFGTAHRAEASTEGVIAKAKIACAGPLLAAELDALAKALDNPAKPMLAIVGGSKVSTKLDVLKSLAKICDQIIVGGGIANTFLAAKGANVGASLYEADMVETAKSIMQETHVLLPDEVVVAKKSQIDFDDFLGSLESADAVTKLVNTIADDEMILDISASSAAKLADAIKNAKTILWNGPVGVFEVDKFGEGTKIVSEAVAASEGFSIAGGGDTLAAIDKYKVADKVSYTSTGGGAFLEFVEGKTLPAVHALSQRA
ncbi:phosphoglycerate kinase [Moraxella osloensis]|uniref:Phosphoglycerate kinase n=1 Tax=Enhydrobacter aerosaccus TaxID=225324 RepID=A0ABR5IQ14_9HYPH|nr:MULTISPECIES: phosphoglycerate kinase [Pseudomonadota]KND23064.1 phosphoglycerate kinase [Enhydrobacter aerosaccus]OBX58195.1 phosphoglycerate kinase [Moraxella osloensis]WNP26624.1 phosphoglycerate kinase [Moraxella sp. DOX410]VXB07538.1 phosphoglycerate kinase [Enhydrobacter sp. AX1]BAV11592.1 phosphoglycerate kinase [Moraxella osloensis]